MTAQQYRCQACGGTFSSERELETHQRQAHGAPAGAGSYRCPECGGTFGTQQDLEQHVRASHE